jgi:hypothetical protein
MINKIRRSVGGTVLHAGWACMGQECDCDDPALKFNRLARWIGPGKWDDMDEPIGVRTKTLCYVGGKTVLVASKIMGFMEHHPRRSQRR